ncbi:MAG: LytTR family DNA-binding domain-containing protein [bacterium]
MSVEQARLRVIIVDDEPVARQRVRRLIAREPQLEIVAECANGREALSAVEQHAPDLLVLDIQMPELDGFSVLAALPPERMPMVIFVTAFDEHALRAFDVHAIDYVLKPIDPDRFRVAIDRACKAHARDESAEQHERLRGMLNAWGLAARVPDAPSAHPSGPVEEFSAVPGSLQRFLVKTDGKMFFVNAGDVDWIEADGNYIRLHVGSVTHMIRETIASIERALPPARFARIHRSAIVNLDRVAEMRQWSSGDYIVVLTNGARLKLSRTYRANIEARAR